MLLLAWFVLLFQNQPPGDYVSRICHKLSPTAEVRFAETPEITASILPGGRIVISAGLFARLQNEAALAGVLAHEIAHLSAGTTCLRFVKAQNTAAADVQNDREHEREADDTAIRTLIKAGYDPMAMLDFFSKYRRETADLPTAFSAEDLLIEKLQIEATDHPLKGVILNTPDFDRVHGSMK
jgi:predicted Zn-dependent protease